MLITEKQGVNVKINDLLTNRSRGSPIPIVGSVDMQHQEEAEQLLADPESLARGRATPKSTTRQ